MAFRGIVHPLPDLPPKLAAYLRELGVDLADPAMAAAFVEGVKVAEDAIDAEASLDAREVHVRAGSW